jgi:hypothetical protein
MFFIIPALSGRSLMELFSTHPTLEKRVAALEKVEAELDAVEWAVGQGDAAVAEEEVQLLAVAGSEPDAERCAGHPRDDAAAEVALEVEGDAKRSRRSAR